MKIDEFKTIEIHKPEKNPWVTKQGHKEKEIEFNFKLSTNEKEGWNSGKGIPKLSKLLTVLSDKYGDINSFRLGFFKGDPEPLVENEEKKIVLLNWDKFFGYGKAINKLSSRYEINKLFYKMSDDFSTKVIQHFFARDSIQQLIEDVQNSYYKTINDLIRSFERLPTKERKEIEAIFESTSFGNQFKKRLISLKPESPEAQLILFVDVIDKLGTKQTESLLKAILSSKISDTFIAKMRELPQKEQVRIAKQLPKMIALTENYEKIEKSLNKFERMIEYHKKSDKKDEKEIHKFLAKEWWLLGIEYFDKIVKTDINEKGNQTNETRVGRLRPDFVIEKYDGIKDYFKVIEIEAANDGVFNKDGTLSNAVFDGINQAIRYVIEQKMMGLDSKGIAIIGSLKGNELNELQKKRLRLLEESFHNIEILTYDEIIEKAKTTISFFQNYNKKRFPYRQV